MMVSGSIEYILDTSKIVVWVDGNLWEKKAKGLDEAGVDLNDNEAVSAFTKAAAPGGGGLEKWGYERVRMTLGSGAGIL